MILVNNPGEWAHVYWPLLHVPWHGWTPTDLIFPFFLFMVGMSLTFSRRARAPPGPRALAQARRPRPPPGASTPTSTSSTLRWPGVLQRIGICYLAAWAAKRCLPPAGPGRAGRPSPRRLLGAHDEGDGPRGPPAEPRDADEPLGPARPDPARAPRLEPSRRPGTPRGRSRPSPRSPRRCWASSPASGCAPPAGAVREDAGPAPRRARPHRARRPLGRGGAVLAALPGQQEHLDVVLRAAHRRPRRRRSSASPTGSWTWPAGSAGPRRS